MSSVRSSSSRTSMANHEPVRVGNWPLRDDGPWAWLLLAVVLSVPAAIHLLGGGMLVSGAAGFALAASTWRLWVPVTFEFGPRGLSHEVLGRRRLILWQHIIRVEVKPRGIFFFTTSDRSHLAFLRSLFVRDRGRRDEILAVVQRFAQPAAAAGSSIRSSPATSTSQVPARRE